MSRAPDRAWWQGTLDVTLIGFALGVAWGMKDFYRHAGFEDLRWVLAPTRRLVEWLTGTGFEAEAHRGYLSRDRLFTLVPACAGVNFMIIAFASLTCGLAHTCRSLRDRITLLLASAAAAYAVTVVANAVRISFAIHLHRTGATLGPLSEGRLHAATGALVYLFFLSALFAIAARMSGARRDLAH
jgi:exosortase K